jgi:hypothetical protein
VKENQNTLNYNIWSGGEYKNNLEDITYIPQEDIVKITNEYSAIGETSIQLKSTVNETKNFILSNTQYESNIRLTAKAHIRILKGNAYFRISKSDGTVVSQVLVNEGTCDEITVSGVTPSSGYYRILISTSTKDVTLYMDNISLILS